MISSSEMSKPWTGRSSPQTATFAKTKKPFVKPFMPRLVRSKSPDHVIGYGSTIQGRFEFAGLLRVEGRFEGVLKPALGATVAVARSGVIVGDIDGCHSVVVEGTVVGNVTASLADLRRHAHVEGNVWCKDLAAAPTAAFRNRAAVTTAPTATTASANNRRRSSSTSRSSSGSFDAAEAAASRAAALAAAAAGSGASASASSESAAVTTTSSSPSALSSSTPLAAAGGIGGGDDSAVGPAPGTPAQAGASGAAPRAADDEVVADTVGLALSVAVPPPSVPISANASGAVERGCPVMHQRTLPLPPPPLPSRPRNDVITVMGHSKGGLSSADPVKKPELSAVDDNRCGLVHMEPLREHLEWKNAGDDCGDVGEAEAEGEEEPSEASGDQEMISSSDGPCGMMGRFSGCPMPHGFLSGDVGSETNAQPEQRHVWRDCSKMYGVKCHSLTKAFSSVAVMLKFDEDMVFEEHLQMEYAAENLWFWKRGMKFRSRRFDNFEARKQEAKCIYDAFLAVEAPDQVNISHEDREDVLAALEGRPGAQAVGSGLFDEALIQVENMLAMGPFPRFADSSVKNIEKSWRMVLESLSIEDVGETFYSVLFEVSPHFEGMFTRSKRVQGKMLMEIINSSVKLLKNLQDLVPMLIQLGLRHNAYKVKAEHYPVVGDALVATLSLALGERLTSSIRQSWIAVYTLMSNIMISMLDEEESSLGGTEEVSIADSDASRLSSGALSVSAGSSSATGTEKASMSIRRIGSARVQPSGAGGGGITASTVKGMYRRGTNSFRNRFSSFAFARKDNSSNNNDDPAISRRHQQSTQQQLGQLRQTQQGATSSSSKPSAASNMPPLAPPSTMGASSSGSSSDSAPEVLLGGVTLPGGGGRSRGGARRQGGNTRVLLGLG